MSKSDPPIDPSTQTTRPKPKKVWFDSGDGRRRISMSRNWNHWVGWWVLSWKIESNQPNRPLIPSEISLFIAFPPLSHTHIRRDLVIDSTRSRWDLLRFDYILTRNIEIQPNLYRCLRLPLFVSFNQICHKITQQ